MFVGAFANCARYVPAGSERPRRCIPASACSRSFASRVWLRTLPCPEMSLSSLRRILSEGRALMSGGVNRYRIRRFGACRFTPVRDRTADIPDRRLRANRRHRSVTSSARAGSRMHTLFVTDLSAFLSHRTFHQQHQRHQHQRHHGQHHKDIEIRK
jgi:hypothetical protein